jgi:hypothetical protein
MSGAPTAPTPQLLGDIPQLIEGARQQAGVALNAGQTPLYWHIGRRIHTELLAGERAAYGAQIVATASRQLVQEYGRGFTETNLRHTVQVAQTYASGIHVAEYLNARPSKEILQAKLHEAFALSLARLDHRSGDEA